MADTAIEITAGTGTNIDTRTEATNGNHRQVIVIGDPATNAGVAPVDATNGLAVQIIPALPAGTNAIGKLAANSGVDIGDVDVLSIAAGDNNVGNVDIVSGTVTTVSTVTNLSQLGGVAIDMGTGVRGAGTQRVTIATNDSVPVTFTGSGDVATQTTLAAINTKLTTGTVIGDVNAVCTNAGTFAVQADLGANNDVTVTNATASNLKAEVVGTGTFAVQADLGANNDVTISSGKTILRAVISGATSGNNTVIAAVADKKIKVLSVALVAATAVAVRFESGADGTALTGVMSIGATGGFVLPPPADPNMYWFETGANTLLNMELGGAVQVSGVITYFTEA